MNNTDFIALSENSVQMKTSDVDSEWMNIANALDNDKEIDKTYAQIVNPTSSPSPSQLCSPKRRRLGALSIQKSTKMKMWMKSTRNLRSNMRKTSSGLLVCGSIYETTNITVMSL